jgi:hypothetical protein
MGKYLQDISMNGPKLPLKGFSEEKRRSYDAKYAHLWPSFHLLKTLYNHYLPNKYETGHHLWRFIIHLEEQTAVQISELGFVVDCIQPFDNTYVKSLAPFDKKSHLLDLHQNGLRTICQQYHCAVYPFEQVYERIKEKGIVLSEAYRKPKLSPNRQYKASLHVFIDEEGQEVSVQIEDKNGFQVQKIKVSNQDFHLFDEITWETNTQLRVSYINAIQSYRRKKVSDDYFQVSLEGSVKYVPVTREALFQHALTLFATGEEKKDEAVSLLKSAENQGHGKAMNVLTNMAINPQERNWAKLTQTPKKRLLKK